MSERDTPIIILNGPHRGRLVSPPPGAAHYRMLRPKTIPMQVGWGDLDGYAREEATVTYEVVRFGAGNNDKALFHHYLIEEGSPCDSATLFRHLHELLLEKLTGPVR